MAAPLSLRHLVIALERAGCVAAEEEAVELVDAAGGDDARLEAMVARRVEGEPLAWITGRARFCEIELQILPGVYVPRWQSEPLARLARARMGARGTAIDVCTGSGAIAAFLAADRPHARVLATELDPTAVACARANGVDVRVGDLLEPVGELEGQVDVIVGVVPYVPTEAMRLLARDTLTFESPRSYDGGVDGVDLLRRVIASSPALLRPRGSLLLELGADQAPLIAADLEDAGFEEINLVRDVEGDLRGIDARVG